MSIKVIRPGFLTTIQDLGRYGFQKYGVIISGAMDTISLRIANLLVGNKEDEAGLEVTLLGPTLIMEEDVLLAITGGNNTPTINGISIPLWRPVFVRKGSKLQFGSYQSGCRTYIAFAGGITINKVMESKSTYLRGKLGGFKGRALMTDDIVPIDHEGKNRIPIYLLLKNKNPSQPFSYTEWYVNPQVFFPLNSDGAIRILKGKQFHSFSLSSQLHFFEGTYKVTTESDRMGYRLSGPPLRLNNTEEFLSEAVTHGTIQVPIDGQPIVLLADRQTTGGYPIIAHIATIDLPKVGQIKPGESIRFQEISLEEAEMLLIESEMMIEKLKKTLFLKYEYMI